jgi:predicted TIM-barrel fold metal-dependent hydrolase
MTAAPRFGGIQADRPAYLARQPDEPVLEPDLPIIDAHHHLWDIKGSFDVRLGGASQRYLVDEYAADAASGHTIEATVFVECRSMYRAHGPARFRSVGEVEFAAGMGAMADNGAYGPTRIAAVVMGQVDLAQGAAAREGLEACAAAGAGRFRGVRHSAGWANRPGVRNNASSTGPELYRSAEFQAGARCLSAMGFVLDVFLFHHQLEDVAALARAVPEGQIALCHCGGPLGFDTSPEHQQAVFEEWRRNIRAVAACGNVSVKLGGMLNRLGAFDFRSAERPPTSGELAALWRPYIETCIELFGVDRCMFESNFPVEKMGVSFKVLWNAFKRIAAAFSDAEKARLFSGTARDFYSIPGRRSP